MILESSHAMLWLVLHTCSAKADFELLKLETALWCSFRRVQNWPFCLTQIYFLAITAWYRVYSMCFVQTCTNWSWPERLFCRCFAHGSPCLTVLTIGNLVIVNVVSRWYCFPTRFKPELYHSTIHHFLLSCCSALVVCCVLFIYCDICNVQCVHVIYIVVREMPCMSRSYRTAFTFLPFWATVCLLYLHSVRAQFCWERGKINLPKLLI